MKTLIHNATKQSKYIWADDVVVTPNESTVVTTDLIICDLNSTNATLVENVTPPEDWYGCKYLYDDGAWTLNPNWVDLTQPVQE